MRKEREERVLVYTDGACEPNPGPGGWAAILQYKGHTKELSGAEPDTTNNRMEMTAAIRAIEALKRSCPVVLYTDSQYLRTGVTEWMPNWKRRNWKRKRGAIKNLDLWQRLDELTQAHDIEWRWVKGHAGNPFNERCDELANKAAGRIRRGGRTR